MIYAFKWPSRGEGGVTQCAWTVEISDDLCSQLTSLGGFKGLGFWALSPKLKPQILGLAVAQIVIIKDSTKYTELTDGVLRIMGPHVPRKYANSLTWFTGDEYVANCLKEKKRWPGVA